MTTLPNAIKLSERNHVEKPLLDQLAGLGWEVIDLTEVKQTPAHTFRESFAEVVMLPVLRVQLKAINPWLEADQVEEVVKQLTANFATSNLLENNRHVHTLLLENTSVSENRQTGAKSPTVRLVEFDPQRVNHNRFIAVCQLKVRILGAEHHFVPDIVLFLNGLPVVVIECKSPKAKEPIPEAIDQLMRYSEQRGAKGEGSPPLFYTNQFIVATCRDTAKFGTLTTPTEKYFYRWADPYPLTVEELAHGSSGPNDQQRLVAGMLARQNLLDLIRTFTLFSTNDKGQTIKVVGRYQQFRAVKLAVKRLLAGKTARERSGIIWHTQGSGKSLTMMFMVREMYRHPQLSQWKVIFVTDRTQLEQQLSETGQSIGFSVKPADSIATLKELLRSDSSDLVMAMIHKFQERDLTQTFPELNASPHILVMTDEAHRTQYALLGANLDKAIPNASRIGYTGTPIDKTERVFGDYIDKYTMRQSIEDGVTLEIIYEGRTHNAEIPDRAGLDTTFADVFSDYNLAERLQILGYGSRNAYLEANETIAAKARDMVRHYLAQVFPNGFKAQVVATSREAAARYKTAIDAVLTEARAAVAQPLTQNWGDWEGLKLLTAEQRVPLHQFQTDVVISDGHNDLPHLKAYADKTKHQTTIKSFKLSFGGQDNGISGAVGLVIVNEMLLTGFDAPIEQVLYLDKVIIAHNLLQTIARVNRVNSGKEKGFVVDYVGIGHHLKKAIDTYDEKEQAEVLDTLSFPEEEVRTLQADYRQIMDLLAQHGLTDLTDLDAFFDLFYDEDIRFEYMAAFKALTRSLNLVFPAKEALDYMRTYQTLTEINVLAARHLNDQRLSMKGIPAKLRTITDAYLQSRGIEQKIEPISILDDDFESEVGQRKRVKTKAAAIEHAIRHHIDIDLADDPELQASFAEALAAILAEFKDNWQKIYEELEKLRQRMRQADQEPTYGLNKKKQMPFFRMFKSEFEAPLQNFVREKKVPYGPQATSTPADETIGILVDLTQQVYLIIERELQLTGFWESIPARNKLKADLQKLLLSPDFVKIPGIISKRAALISRLMEIAEKNNDAILYAA
jgi:type I restriction enzyme R subunit